MSLSTLPLAYCANVHPGEDFSQAFDGLKQHCADVRQRIARTLGVGIWMTRTAIQEAVADPMNVQKLHNWLVNNDVVCYTMNAFPFGNFHARRVKEQVYQPDWTDERRRDYSLACARVLARLLPPGVEGSISTLPLAFKSLVLWDPSYDDYFPRLIETALGLAEIRAQTGRWIRLAIEPEPLCLLETTDEAIAFFQTLWRSVAGSSLEKVVRDHIGLCYDVCHQAVEFENVADSIVRLDAAGIRIAKIHITCALEIPNPKDLAARNHLSQFIEERYLHQTFGRRPGKPPLRWLDLSKDLTENPTDEWLQCDTWRTHFHVPVDLESIGVLRTTRPAVEEALAAVAGLGYAPHLEVETYTWNVLSDGRTNQLAAPSGNDFVLARGIAMELESVQKLIDRLV